MTAIRTTYLSAARVVPAVVTAATEHWSEPSALEGWTIGGLTGHFVRGVATVARYLDQPTPPRGPEMDAVDYFDSLDLRGEDFAKAVIGRGDTESADGPAMVAERVEAWVDALEQRLPGLAVDRRVAALDAFALTLDEYLKTRLVELVVHHADLAVSLDVPEMPAGARTVAIEVLVALARRRHGDRAVIDALTRSERAGGIAYF